MLQKNKISYLAPLLILSAGAAMAQQADPPARVARLDYLSGQVSFRPVSVDDWAAATLNYPLTTGDHLWNDPGAQTEMHIGSTAIRMGSETALVFLNLDDRTVQPLRVSGEQLPAGFSFAGTADGVAQPLGLPCRHLCRHSALIAPSAPRSRGALWARQECVRHEASGDFQSQAQPVGFILAGSL